MKLCSMNEELNLLKVSVSKIRFQTALRARAVDVINKERIPPPIRSLSSIRHQLCRVKVNKMPFYQRRQNFN